ncbi:MAG: hypothetical protein RMM53_10250 [Bacteroidia bacterium]|nr:hypothetical protein [Bacteroidia bacterium]MDW8334584.1 hypothetical protein [Bacteroidia bacterium]
MNGKILVYTGYVMGVVFIVMGVYTFVAYRGKEGAGGLPTEWFGVLAAFYGGFRIWRSWKLQKKWENRTE